MNRRDQYGSGQQPGGNRDETDSWDRDAPRQASQWSDTGRQASGSFGGSWGHDDNRSDNQSENQRDSQRGTWDNDRNRSRDFEDRWVDPERGGSQGQYRGEHRDRGDFGSRSYSAGAYGGSLGGRDFEDNRQRGGHGGYGASDYGRSRNYGQSSHGYGQEYRRSQGSRGGGYSSRPFDASGGQDFSSFTSEDYGGRDFTADRGGGGISGGMHPSDTYRPASLFGSGSGAGSGWRDSGSDDYSAWREHGERRGFLARAGDEIASWFGDDDAARRREQDHRGRGPSDYTRSDERIREDVNDKLTHDWRVDATAVRVTVKDGEVSLDGTVSSRDAKRRAEDVADGVSGVKHVQNNLRVQQSASTSQGGWSGGTAASVDPSGSWSGGSAAGIAGSGDSGSGASGTGTSGTGASSTTGASGSLSGSTTSGATTSSSGTSITGGTSSARGTTGKAT